MKQRTQRPSRNAAKTEIEPAGPLANLRRRVLIASHGHPSITRGGAEIAAYALFKALGQDPAYDVWFLGCRPDRAGGHMGVSITQPFGEREFVYTVGDFDWFTFANRDTEFPNAFRKLLEEIRPDIIHFHHFLIFGIESFWLAKQTLPAVKIILTVHEYLLICNADGQMVTSERQLLCYQATPEACHACFPKQSRANFFLRRNYTSLFLPSVDALIAPSVFLAARLRAWDARLPHIEVIENVVDERVEWIPTKAARLVPKLRVGFFGQISRLKGIGVLLEAAGLLEAGGEGAVAIEIYGTYEGQSPEYQAEFLEQLAQAGSNVRYHGPYLPRQVDALMQSVEVVIVPSIWWENSPVVIQEAFRNRRPVICTGIGGMAEKVRDGIDGWHIPVGDAAYLASLLTSLAANPQEISGLNVTSRIPATVSETLTRHRRLYDEVSGGAVDTPVPA